MLFIHILLWFSCGFCFFPRANVIFTFDDFYFWWFWTRITWNIQKNTMRLLKSFLLSLERKAYLNAYMLIVWTSLCLRTIGNTMEDLSFGSKLKLPFNYCPFKLSTFHWQSIKSLISVPGFPEQGPHSQMLEEASWMPWSSSCHTCYHLPLCFVLKRFSGI